MTQINVDTISHKSRPKSGRLGSAGVLDSALFPKMDIECFACGEEIETETAFLVTTYRDLLIVLFAFEEDTKKNYKYGQEIRFYKIEKNELIVHSQISKEEFGEVDSGSVWSTAPKLFAFDSLELQKPVLVLVSSHDLRVYDFEGTFLAEEISIPSHNLGRGISDLKYRFTLWKQHYLVDWMRGVLHLGAAKASDFRRNQTILPYKIKWTHNALSSRSNIFNMADRYIMEIQYPGYFTSILIPRTLSHCIHGRMKTTNHLISRSQIFILHPMVSTKTILMKR